VDEIRIIVEEATRLGKSVTAHCLATESVRRGVAADLLMIEHAAFFRSSQLSGTIGFIADDGFDYRPEIVEDIVNKQIPVSQSIIGWHRHSYHQAVNYSPEEQALLDVQLGQRRDHLHDMRTRGVRFLAGSDGWTDIPREYFA